MKKLTVLLGLSLILCTATAQAQVSDDEIQLLRQQIEMSFRSHLDQLGDPAIVGTATDPLEIGRDIFRRHPDARAERRRVHLGDSVREDDFAGDPVVVERLFSESQAHTSDASVGSTVSRRRAVPINSSQPYMNTIARTTITPISSLSKPLLPMMTTPITVKTIK